MSFTVNPAKINFEIPQYKVHIDSDTYNMLTKEAKEKLKNIYIVDDIENITEEKFIEEVEDTIKDIAIEIINNEVIEEINFYTTVNTEMEKMKSKINNKISKFDKEKNINKLFDFELSHHDYRIRLREAHLLWLKYSTDVDNDKELLELENKRISKGSSKDTEAYERALRQKPNIQKINMLTERINKNSVLANKYGAIAKYLRKNKKTNFDGFQGESFYLVDLEDIKDENPKNIHEATKLFNKCDCERMNYQTKLDEELKKSKIDIPTITKIDMYLEIYTKLTKKYLQMRQDFKKKTSRISHLLN